MINFTDLTNQGADACLKTGDYSRSCQRFIVGLLRLLSVAASSSGRSGYRCQRWLPTNNPVSARCRPVYSLNQGQGLPNRPSATWTNRPLDGTGVTTGGDARPTSSRWNCWFSYRPTSLRWNAGLRGCSLGLLCFRFGCCDLGLDFADLIPLFCDVDAFGAIAA